MDSLSEAEEDAFRKLEPELKESAQLLQAVYDLIGIASRAALPQGGTVSPAATACGRLLVRAANDLRCAALLARTGYPAQAGTLISTVVEVSLTTAYIGRDDARAKKWWDHDDPTRGAFEAVRDMSNSMAQRLRSDGADELCRQIYSTYRQLCWAKHASPVFQRLLGLQDSPDGQALMNGPEPSDLAVRGAWLAMYWGSWFCFQATKLFAADHVSADPTSPICAQLKDVENVLLDVSQKIKARGWNQDPFPGRWRV